MKRKAVIAISSSQLPKKDDVIEALTPGNYYKESDFYYAEYDETEISGMQGTKTKLEIHPERLSIIREGTTNAKMEFEESKNYKSLYNTPYGTMEIQIHTKKLKVNVNEEGGDIYIYYNMSISGQKPQNTELKINIKTH